MRCGRVSSRCFRSPVAVRGAAADGRGSPSARRSPASCLCCAAGCRGRCYRVKWDAAQAARAGDAWWSGNGPASGVACMRPSSPSCADGDGSTSAGRWWTAGRSARCAGEKTGPNPTDRRKAGSKHHIVTDARGVPLVAHVTAANVNDITHLDALVADLPAVRGRRGRPAPTARRPAGRPWLRFATTS